MGGYYKSSQALDFISKKIACKCEIRLTTRPEVDHKR